MLSFCSLSGLSVLSVPSVIMIFKIGVLHAFKSAERLKCMIRGMGFFRVQGLGCYGSFWGHLCCRNSTGWGGP